MNLAVVVDTDVVSYLFKSHPVATLYLEDLTDRVPVISFMTVAELDRWALDAKWGEARRSRLQEYLSQFAVIPYNREICRKWAEVTVSAGRVGRRIDCADAWIAATALLSRSPLITHNRRDYVGVPGLSLISHGEAHGAAAKVTLGNAVVERWTWSPGRLQARRLRVGTETAAEQVGKLEWSYCGGGGADQECASNNGNVMAQWVQPVNESQTYGYDGRNRLTSAEGMDGAAVKWRETLVYDGRGNRAVSGTRVGLPGLTSQTPQSVGAFTGQNRVAAWSYDAAGNVLSLGASTGEYDGENRLWRHPREWDPSGTAGGGWVDGTLEPAGTLENRLIG